MNAVKEDIQTRPAASDGVLAKIDRATAFLAEAKSLQEVNAVVAMAEAAGIYAKRVHASQETINRAAEIRLRAERKLGELLKVNPPKAAGARGRKGGGTRGSQKEPQVDAPETLASAGIDKKISSRAQAMADVSQDEFEEAIATPPGKELNHNRVVKELKEKKQRESRQSKRAVAAKDAPPSDDRIIVGDFRKNADKVADGSVSLIFTDPPYDREASKMLPALGEFAAKKLADGGSMICYVGHTQLPDAIIALKQHLRYWWTIACVHAGGKSVMREYGINACWKPVLWFVKKTRDDNSVMVNDVMSGGQEKSFHDWQQSQSEAEYWIKNLCPKDGLVCDPFLGGGTTAAAAKSLGRQWIGFEIDADHAAVARKRVA